MGEYTDETAEYKISDAAMRGIGDGAVGRFVDAVYREIAEQMAATPGDVGPKPGELVEAVEGRSQIS